MLLKHEAVSHGGIRPVFHPHLGVTINGQTCIRTLRFLRPVRIDHLELGLISGPDPAPMGGSGRWVPNVPTHPAHLLISILDERREHWQVVKEVDLPANPVIAGEGLSQEMSVDEMNALLNRARDETRHVIDLGGLRTDHLRVECDREHPVWPSHGEMNGGVFGVPFSTLSPLQAFGEPAGDSASLQLRLPLLKKGLLQPVAPQGMTVTDLPDMLFFQGERLAVGFSLRRPMLMHLGWDAFGVGAAGENRLAQNMLCFLNRGDGVRQVGLSGPLLRAFEGDCGAHLWTGEVSVEGNRVAYRNLRPAVEGLTVDAIFTVEPERLLLELVQRCERALPVLEFEAWRLAWDIGAAMTGAMAMPTLLPGRNGDVELPMLWGASGPGCLSCRAIDDPDGLLRLQVESYRFQNRVTGGLYLGAHADNDTVMTIPAGTRRATVELAVTTLEPVVSDSASPLGSGVSRRWAAPFACFRPELGGFSNQAVSVHCLVNHSYALELICRTRKPEHGPDPLDLARFTVGRALLDGSGFGYHRNLYMDSDPQLLMSAGRIHQVQPRLGWLREIEPGLIEAVSRTLATLDEDGQVCCRDLSGNTGSHRWSSNCMDVIGFGHQDAYVSALAYCGFRNGAALLADLGRRDMAQRCREAAQGIRANYARVFLNPRTGWIAGWRSRDGQLHDYAFVQVNGVAIAFGLLDEQAARNALLKLEALRTAQGLDTGRMGLPFNLLSIDPGDHMLPLILGEHVPTFENYTDGSLGGSQKHYLRALSIYGLKEQAQELARELDEAFAYGLFDGGQYSGSEFHSWEGMANGYEGTFGVSFGTLYAIAIEQGALRPLEPEWWPAGG